MRVPHEREARFRGRRICDRAGWRGGARGTGGPHGRVWPEIRTAAEPRAVGEQVRIGQSHWAATCHIPERSRLKRLVVILTPLVVIEVGGDRVITSQRAITRTLSERVGRERVVTVRV